MWNENKEALIKDIESLKDKEMIAMGQCGFIFNLGNKKLAIDLIVSDLYYKGTDVSRRVVKPPFDISDTPDLDYVLITHDHADHLDKALILELANREKPFKVIAPLHILTSLNIPSSCKIELEDYETYSDGDISITPIPVPHMEYKYSSKKHSEFLGYVIEYDGLRIFHGGDLVPDSKLSEAIKKKAPFDYMFLPINGRDKKKEAKGIIGNMDGEEAIAFAISNGTSILVPTHFDFFKENGADTALFSRLAKERIKTIVPVPGNRYSLI